mgnify:CR=1 FL=1
MYHIFDVDVVHMLDAPMEFANWIEKLGFNPHPLVSYSDFIKEYEGEGEYQGESKNIAKYVFIPQK